MKLKVGYFPPLSAYPTDKQLAAMMSYYDRLSLSLGDDPNAIADSLGWTRGTGCVIRRMTLESRAA